MSYRHLDTLSAFTANLDFSSAAASRTMTATAASGTSRFVSECDDSVGDLLAQTFSCAVAIRTIPVASRVTIEASMVGHTAPPKSFGDFDLVSRRGQHMWTKVDRGRGSAMSPKNSKS
jgi:hypothetical protein